MGSAIRTPDGAIAKVNDALDEQLIEVKLFRQKMQELSTEMALLRTGVTRYEDKLESIAVANTALNSEARKTIALMNRHR